jgi:hypothetical protein
MLIGGAVWFSMAVTFSRAPIDISVYTPRASPATDASIAGIGWDHHYTELVIGVTNPSQEDYHDLDLVFQPDQWVHKAALPESYGCQLSMVGASVIKISGHPKTGIMTFSGHLLGTKLGVDDSLGNAYDDYASQGGFRLRCSTFASVSTVTIVFALVSFKPELLANTMPPSTVSRGGFGLGVSAWKVDDGIDAFLEPRPSSRLLRYNGKYLKGLKPYRIDRSTSVSVE